MLGPGASLSANVQQRYQDSRGGRQVVVRANAARIVPHYARGLAPRDTGHV